MKRGLSGKTRRGGPPLERQRIAFRVIQLTFVGVALTMFWFAWSAFGNLSSQSALSPLEPVPPTSVDVAAFLVGGVLAALAAALMGFRTVRGPRLPPL